MKIAEKIASGEKRGRIFAYKALIFAGLVLCTLFPYSKAQAQQVSYTNVASTSYSTYSLPASHYVAFPQTLPTLKGVRFGGLYKSGGCATGIYMYTFDIMASSSLDITGARHASFSSGTGDGAGGCRYTLSAIRSGGLYPAGTVAATTTGVYIPAGNYWFLYTATVGQVFAGTDGGVESARVYKFTVPSGWVGYYDINYPTLYLVSATSTVAAPSETPDDSTRLINFTPAEGAVLPSATPVTFSLTAYINPDDIGQYIGVRFTFHNIDQNVLLLNRLSPSDFYILDGFEATTSGMFTYVSSPYTLGDGNYRAEAQIERSYLGGWFVNPFSPINDTQSHQFIVGSSTFLGNFSQTAFDDLQTFFASSTATSTQVTSRSCNPLAWDTQLCLSYLFIPSSADMTNTILGLKDMVLSRVPWGYATRFYNIISSTATTALPTFSVNLHLGAGSLTPATSTLSFDPDDMLSGGAALAGSIKDVTYGKTAREILEPLIRMGVALMVLFIIVGDLLQMGGREATGSSGGGGGRSGMQRQAALTKREYNF